jgi:hypothetical protein
MAMFLVVFLTMITLITLMSVGVIMGRKPISGSCGGMSALGMDVACDICKGDLSKCEAEIEKVKKNFNTEPGKEMFHEA